MPWGEDTLFTLEFREEANKYAVHTCTNMYLQTDGKLAPQAHKVLVGAGVDGILVGLLPELQCEQGVLAPGDVLLHLRIKFEF